ncbi:MAG: 50S ribosomal protein L35 [Bacillota bacterium]
MPKMKTHSGAAKRFKKTGKGNYMRRQACASHLLRKKNADRKRRLRKSTMVKSDDVKRVKQLIQ